MDLTRLYEEMILEHNRSPRNFFEMQKPDAHADAFNPLCGDHYQIYIKMDLSGERIAEASFTGTGCAISKSSASMMTEALRGMTRGEAMKILDLFCRLVTQENACDANPAATLGPLMVFENIRRFPTRVKCATIAWRGAEEAIRSIRRDSSTQSKGQS